MIISGTIALDATGQAATCRDLRSRLADLEDRRSSAARTVAALLETWHGPAAARFGEQWAQWDDGATAVLAGLEASLVAVDLARADLLGSDSRRGEAAAQLAGRLG